MHYTVYTVQYTAYIKCKKRSKLTHTCIVRSNNLQLNFLKQKDYQNERKILPSIWVNMRPNAEVSASCNINFFYKSQNYTYSYMLPILYLCMYCMNIPYSNSTYMCLFDLYFGDCFGFNKLIKFDFNSTNFHIQQYIIPNKPRIHFSQNIKHLNLKQFSSLTYRCTKI